MKLLFDIGGTHFRSAVSRGGKLADVKIIRTPQNFHLACKHFAKIKNSFDNKISSVVVSIAGVISKDKDRLLSSPHLKDWENKPIKNLLKNIFRTSVLLENDASLAGLAEARKGAGQGAKIVAYLTIGTGIGGARIINNKIDAHNYGFEAGHQILGRDKNGRYLTLDNYISGSAIQGRFNNDSHNLKKGHRLQVEKFLAVGLNNISVLWSPDIIVVGGSFIEKKLINLKNVSGELKNILKIFPPPKIVAGKLKYPSLEGALLTTTAKKD